MNEYRHNHPDILGIIAFVLAILALSIPHSLAFAGTAAQTDIEPTKAHFAYPIFYTRDINGDILVTWKDGHTDRFVEIDGKFISPAGSDYQFRE